MARISEGQGPSNNPEERYRVMHEEEGGEPSPGTSSSTSGSKPDKSGTSGTTDLQSPAPDAESPSERGQQARPVSSSARTTDGSGQGTGSSPWSPPDSLEDSAQQKEATPGQVLEGDEVVDDPYEGLSGHELMALARDAYEARKYDEAATILDRAETVGTVSDAELATARGYVARARAVGGAPRGAEGSPAAGTGPSEADPAAGGYLADR